MTTSKVPAFNSPSMTERKPGMLDTLSFAFAALVAGSRAIPLGDNGKLLRELASRGRTTSR